MKRPFLELTALSRLAVTANFRSLPVSVARAKQALEIAEKHGWTGLPVVGLAYWAQSMCLVWQGRMDKAEPLLDLAEQGQQPDVEPAEALAVIHTRAMIDLLRDKNDAALKKLLAGERLASRLGPGQGAGANDPALANPMLARLGETGRVEQALAQLNERELDDAQMRIALAWVSVTQKQPAAAVAALAPVLDGSAPVASAGVDGMMPSFSKQSQEICSARHRLRERHSNGRYDLAEPDGMCCAFLLHPVRGLLERHRQGGTVHAAFVSDLLDMLSGSSFRPRTNDPGELQEHLSESELRVLRSRPRPLARKSRRELFVSTSTVKTHMRHIYAKLGVHGRVEAVAGARELRSLPPVATLRR